MRSFKWRKNHKYPISIDIVNASKTLRPQHYSQLSLDPGDSGHERHRAKPLRSPPNYNYPQLPFIIIQLAGKQLYRSNAFKIIGF